MFVWVVLSGVGGFSWQNTWDHMFRNAIFNDLVKYAWPVVNSVQQPIKTLTYYFGFWLPSALIAKLFNSLVVGYWMQFIWAFLGVLLTLFLIFNYLKRISLKIVFLFILFSGLDVVIYVLVSKVFNGIGFSQILANLMSWQHLELTLEIVNSSSNTTLLFWLYNQIIPFWIGFMLILMQRKNQSLLFTFSLLMLYSPFPAFSLIPFIIYRMLSNVGFSFHRIKESVVSLLKTSLTLQNTAGVVFMLIMSAFYMSNATVGRIILFPFTFGVIKNILIFLAFEYFVFFPFIWKGVKKNPSYWIMLITTFALSFVILGKCCDFAWRTSIPLTFYTMLLLMKEILVFKPNQKMKVVFLLIILGLGAVTPMMEIMRTVTTTTTLIIKGHSDEFISNDLISIFDENALQGLFIGKNESFFVKYLRR